MPFSNSYTRIACFGFGIWDGYAVIYGTAASPGAVAVVILAGYRPLVIYPAFAAKAFVTASKAAL
jgi:hypothetical protein